MTDYAVVLVAVMLLGAFVGALFSLYRRGPSAEGSEGEAQRDRSHRRDQIVVLAEQLEDRNNYIAQLRMCLDKATEGTCPQLKVKMPETPDWLVQDERV